jgi:transcription elongation factor Elf1
VNREELRKELESQGYTVVDELSNLFVLTELGEREPGKVPPWLSSKKVTCPRCGRTEYGNVNQQELTTCSVCLMNEAIKDDQAGITSVWKHPENHKALPEAPALRLRLKGKRSFRARTCERCGQSFKGRSNRQRFCEVCQRAAYNDKTRARMANFRKGSNGVSVVTK